MDRMQARESNNFIARVLAPGDQNAPARHFQQIVSPARGDSLLRIAARFSQRRANRASNGTDSHTASDRSA